jgi:short-subunit dehydrogenase
VSGELDTPVETIAHDLAEPNAAEEVERLVDDVCDGTVSVLVNSAGIGSTGYFCDTSAARERDLIAVNVRTLTELTKIYLPRMIENDRGGVINVASVAAFFPGPLNAVYYASKSYVLSLTESLAEEVDGTDVTVTAVCPGSTRTRFQRRKGAENPRPDEVDMMAPSVVAEAGYEGFARGERIVIPGLKNRLLVQVARLLPRKLLASLSMDRARKYL